MIINSINTAKCFFLLFFISISFQCNSQQSDLSIETEHFIIKWENENATIEEAKEAQIISEEIYVKYLRYFEPKWLPRNKILIYLGGQAINRETGQIKIPYVNMEGEIFIYKFQYGYFGELAHEMVHAFRIHSGMSTDWFLEEAFAECIASLLFPETYGFARFGYPLTVAAGTWKEKDKLIPLRTLKDKHNDLSMKCQAQSYSLRADFFRYIESKFGKQKLLEFVYNKNAKEYQDYITHFGKDFDQLEQNWLLDLQNRIDEIKDFKIQSQNYLNNTAIRFMKICESGVDY